MKKIIVITDSENDFLFSVLGVNTYNVLKPFIDENKKITDLSQEEKDNLLMQILIGIGLSKKMTKETNEDNNKNILEDEAIFKNNLKMLSGIDSFDLMVKNIEEDFLSDKDFYSLFENNLELYLKDEEIKDGLILLLKNITNKKIKNQIRESFWKLNQKFLFAKNFGNISIEIYKEITIDEEKILSFESLVKAIRKENI